MHIDIGTEYRFTDGVERDVQTLFFLEQCFVKFLNFGHVHINAEQPFDFALLIENPICQRTDMAHAFFHADAELKLKGHSGHQRIANNLLGVRAIFGNNAVVPELPGRLDVRRDFVHLEHAFVPTDDVRLQVPFPDTNSARFVRQRNTLHQAFIHPFGVFKVINVFDLRNKIER
ncbi:hypothetical protein D3C78_1030560 [compost metagenome]